MNEFIYAVSCPKGDEPNPFLSFPKDKGLFQSSYSIECQTWIWLEEFIQSFVKTFDAALPGHIPIPSLSDIVFDYAFDLNDKLRLIIPHRKTFQLLPATFDYFQEDAISKRQRQQNQSICQLRNRKRHLRRARIRAANREKKQVAIRVQQLDADRVSECSSYSSKSSLVSWYNFLRRFPYDRRRRYEDMAAHYYGIERSWQEITVTLEPKSFKESDWRLAHFHHKDGCRAISHGLMIQYCHQGKWYPLSEDDDEHYDIEVHGKDGRKKVEICLQAWSGRCTTTFIRSGLCSNAFIKQLVINHKP